MIVNDSELSDTVTRHSTEDFQRALIRNLYYRLGTTPQSASLTDSYLAFANTVRNYLIDGYRRTTQTHYAVNPKFVYYLSMEYLLGPQLRQNLLYTGVEEIARKALVESGLALETILPFDPEPGLGNGGLGRLAACYLDSLAALDIPAVGYGLRYEFGIFRQTIVDGWQKEQPDDWLRTGNPWEFPQPDEPVTVGLYGRTEHMTDGYGRRSVRWIPGQTVNGEPYHMLVPGYNTGTVNILRLWRARASESFDFGFFDTGDYARAVEQKVQSENITKVLYPNDNLPAGRELRLKQEYFFAACSLRDIIRRFRFRNDRWDEFPEKVVIQLNDTHPVVAIAELMRILVDEEALGWEHAWSITQRVFGYTCHTLLPEALEVWPVALFAYLLPRHLEIIYEINWRFLEEVRRRFPGDERRIARMSIIQEGAERQVRMAHLATVGSFAVNGVAALHSRLLAEQTLSDFAQLWPEKFQNKTNGVTPRRFMRLSNPKLADLITDAIGEGWLTQLESLARLEPYADDPRFRDAWRAVKQENKAALAHLIRAQLHVDCDPAAMFDVMAKRLHEYKRQHLKVLHIITLYHRIKQNPRIDLVPRVFVFGAKAAPGYRMAKLIIKLINNVAAVVNNDPDVADRLKVAFLPNFNVTLAEQLYPAADLSEQISLAGKEASGTGNMKFALNGALTIGTLDGANVEIRELVGPENFFLFGLTTEEVFALQHRGYRPYDYYAADGDLRAAVDAVARGQFGQGEMQLFQPIVDDLLSNDRFMVLADYRAYIDCQDQVDAAFREPEQWVRKSILNTARSGFFSSDRAIRQYCSDIWKVSPVPVSRNAPEGA